MSSGICKGLCMRHPKRAPKRLQGVNFDRINDGVCRQCDVYFRDIADVYFCPCCGRRISRRLSTMKCLRKRMRIATRKLGDAFKYFWKMVDKQYKRKRRIHKRKDMSGRRCLLCNSNKTLIRKNEIQVWCRYLHGYICYKCNCKLLYIEKKKRRNLSNSPLGNLLLLTK
jgi:hypothetical protein